MIDALPEPPDLDPVHLSSAHFTRVRRGFEPTEVNTALGRAADALRAWHERDERLVSRIDDLEQQVIEARDLDEDRITTVLGEETARIIQVAREAAVEMRAKAAADATALIEEAERTSTATAEALVSESTALRTEAAKERDDAREEASLLRQQAIDEAMTARTEAEAAAEAMRSEAATDAARMRGDAATEADRLNSEATSRHEELITAASTVLDERTAEADAEAARIRTEAEAVLAVAQADAARLVADAESAAAAEIERSKAVGREMVAEAREVRERMLRDLAEKRKLARQKIEWARAGRAKILETLRETSDAVDGLIGDLAESDRWVGQTADSAAAGVVDDVDLVVAELEATLMSEHAIAPVTEESVASDDTTPDDTTSDSTESEDVAGDVEPRDSTDASTSDEPDGPAGTDAPGVPDPARADDPPPTDVAALGVEEAATEEVVIEDGADADGPDATVHDLFARIRADVDEVVPVSDGDLPDDSGPLDEAGSVEAGPVADADPATAALDRRDELLAAPEKGLARLLKRAVSDEQNEVLDALRRTPKRQRPDLESLLPADEISRFTVALRPDFDAAVAAGAEFWTEATGGSAEMLLDVGDDPGVGEALTSRVADLLSLRRAHLQRTIDDADAEGLDLTEIADRIRSAYREWRSGAMTELAGDLATAGFAEGIRQAAGPTAVWCWLPDNGGLPCSDAEDNSLAGDVEVGDKFPTGDVLPPAHPGCRCMLVPTRH